jgi:hypothetical protein
MRFPGFVALIGVGGLAAVVANGSVIIDAGAAAIMRVDAGAAKTPWPVPLLIEVEGDDVLAFSPSFPEVPSDEEL